MQNDRKTALLQLQKGLPPGNSELIHEISVGIDFISDFWRDKYLLEYIKDGGSKIKFVTGRQGSGKTHFLELMQAQADSANFKTVSISAKQTSLHDFKDLYFEIQSTCDIMDCLEKCCNVIIKELGFDWADLPKGESFADYLASANLLNPITKREIRQLLSKIFLQNPLIDNNFGIVCGLLAGGILGYPTLEQPSKDLLLLWLSGSKDAKLPALRKLGLSPSKITKYNARHMLRSLSQIVKIAGYSGIFVTIDNLEILVSGSSLETIRYTKMRREDTYESIRQLIDDIDSLGGIMFVFAFDNKLIEDDHAGIKSYQALWMRIQTEISTDRFNRFSDLVDLDQLARQEYGTQVAVRMSQKLADALNFSDDVVCAIDEKDAIEIIERTQFSKLSLPIQINTATIGKLQEGQI